MSGTARRVAFQTLGCRLNQYETDSLATDFKRGGYDVVPFSEAADCYIVNTCTVTDRSDRKSRNLINRADRQARDSDDGEPVVVVTGCYAESQPGYAEERDGVTYVVDNDRKHTIFDLVDAHFRGETREPSEMPTDRFGFGAALDGFHTRATVKIQDGCDNFCTFCIIPFVRGRAVSRPVTDVVEHARNVIGEGARELVFTGVNMGCYDDSGVSIVELIERVLEIPGDFRVRLSSIEPDIRGQGLDRLVQHEKFCPHLHLCLQSGSDRVLLKMRRQYLVGGYLEIVDSIRRRDESFNFTTDILVGFPGETDEDFEETLKVAREVGFSHIHTFPFSVRTGTKAALMPGQVDERTKSDRAVAVRALAAEMKRGYRNTRVGRTARLLVEDDSRGLTGYGEHYLPIEVVDATDIGKIETASMKNTFVDVSITGLGEGDDPILEATIIQQIDDTRR